MHRGYIKIWRKIRESFVWQDAECYKLFCYLVMEANYKETEFMFNGKKHILKRGQLLCGRQKLAVELGISENKIYRSLKCFESEQLIEQQKTNLYTIISIVCYEQYQSNEQLNEQQIDNKQTASRQPVDTSKELIRTKKKDNNTINHQLLLRQEQSFAVIWDLYPRKIGKPQAFSKYCKTVLTGDQAKKCKRAVENYLAEIEDKGTEEKFIKHGSTFFGMWQDYYEINPFVDHEEELVGLEKL